MHFMNTYEIDEARARFRGHPVLGPATQTLANLRDVADANSDGWCYWPKPARSADKLMTLIENRLSAWRRCEDEPDTAMLTAELRKAYSPIKAFRTRSGLSFEIVEPNP